MAYRAAPLATRPPGMGWQERLGERLRAWLAPSVGSSHVSVFYKEFYRILMLLFKYMRY